MRDGVQYSERTTGYKESPQKEYQLVIPTKCRKQLVELEHALQASYRSGCTTGECPYDLAHVISLYRLSCFRVTQNRYENILMVTDHFTKYSQAYPTKNQIARTTAQHSSITSLFAVVFQHVYIVISGEPLKVIKEVCFLGGIDKCHTTPYHPMGNDQCKCFNRTLLEMIGTFEPNQKSDWGPYIALTQF